MPSDDHIAAFAHKAKLAATNVVRLVDHALADSDDATRAAAVTEVEEVMLALIAGVISADSFTTYQEFVFAGLVTKELRDPLRCRAFLDDYAARWAKISLQNPTFLAGVLAYDAKNNTKLTRRIISELKAIALSAAGVDGEDVGMETKPTEAYFERMDAVFRRARWTVKWDEDPLPSFPADSVIQRDEFRPRQVIGQTPDCRAIE